jgi:putative transposase
MCSTQRQSFETDGFTTEVWTRGGLVTYYVLFFIHLKSRSVRIAGITPNPNAEFMKQVARNETMVGWGFLENARFLIHDRDTKFCEAFRSILEDAGVECLKLPARSPNLNAFAERWVLSIKTECLDHLILFGERSLRHALDQYLQHYLAERNHQGFDNRLIERAQPSASTRAIQAQPRLGGLLKYYCRRVA